MLITPRMPRLLGGIVYMVCAVVGLSTAAYSSDRAWIAKPALGVGLSSYQSTVGNIYAGAGL